MAVEPEVMPSRPKCPHCKKALEGMAMFQWVTRGWLIICMYCPSCAVALDFGSMPLPGEESQIQIPS